MTNNLINPSKRLAINHKALHSITFITSNITCCYFKDSNRNTFKLYLSVSLIQIASWKKGMDINLAMPNLSKNVRNIFYFGSTHPKTLEINS